MQIKRLVVGQLQTNCYLVICSKEVLIIDPGDDADYIIRQVSDLKLTPVLIAVTHAHFDHVLAVTELKMAYQIPFIMHRSDLPILKRVQNTAMYFTGIQADPVILPDDYLKDGQKIQIGSEELTVLETTGHTPGGVAFYAPEILISGDVIFIDGIGRTDFSYSSKTELDTSIKKLIKLPTDTRVFPGHGDDFLLGQLQ